MKDLGKRWQFNHIPAVTWSPTSNSKSRRPQSQSHLVEYSSPKCGWGPLFPVIICLWFSVKIPINYRIYWLVNKQSNNQYLHGHPHRLMKSFSTSQPPGWTWRLRCSVGWSSCVVCTRWELWGLQSWMPTRSSTRFENSWGWSKKGQNLFYNLYPQGMIILSTL